MLLVLFDELRDGLREESPLNIPDSVLESSFSEEPILKPNNEHQ